MAASSIESPAWEGELERLFWMPLEKSLASDGRRVLQGIASTEDWDEQQEQVLQAGLDFQPLLSHGFINWDHQRGPRFIIGVPEEAKITERGLFVRGWLFSGHPEADAAWQLMETLEKAGNPRRLGWSIEGSVTQRRGPIIVKAVVRHLALTHQPVNPHTFAELVKSFCQGQAMSTVQAKPLLREHLAGAGYSLVDTLWGSCSHDHFDPDGRFREGRRGALEHLVKCHGYGVEEAKDYLIRLMKSGIL